MTMDELREIKDDIINMYKDGKSIYRIGKILNTHDMKVGTILRENNVELRDKRDNRRYVFNENYFDEINTQEKAYFLGFLYADGCNDKKYNRVTMALEESDGYILEAFRQEINSNKPLNDVVYNTRENNKPQKMIVLNGENFCDKMIKKGLVPNKSLIVTFPDFNIVPECLMFHFIRGYFDGDGYIQNPDSNKSINIQITSSTLFCNGLGEFLNSKQITYKITPENNPLTSSLYVYNYSNESAIRFVNLMYADAKYYLYRKKENADILLEKYKNKHK